MDITISEDSLFQLVDAAGHQRRLMRRIDRNYRFVIGFTGAGLIMLGAAVLLRRSVSGTAS